MKLVTVDFDGTLFQGDSFRLMFEAGKKQFGFKEWNRLTLGSFQTLQVGLTKGKNALRTQFFKSFAATFQHKTKEEIQNFFDELILAGKKQIRPSLLNMIKQEKAAGNEVILLSGALKPFLQALVKELEIDIPTIGTALEYDENNLATGKTGVYIGGDQKVIEVKRWLREKGLHHDEVEIWAYADSESDLPLLLFANKGIVVNPKDKMKRLADSYSIEIYSD